MIKAENLSMVYGKDFKAVDSLSFEIKPGEIVGFAGPNGAGKTTCIKMLTGILKPTEGKATINATFDRYISQEIFHTVKPHKTTYFMRLARCKISSNK